MSNVSVEEIARLIQGFEGNPDGWVNFRDHAEALLVRYRMVPHTVLSQYYDIRQEVHDRVCGCELIGCEMVVGWNEALHWEYTRDKTIEVDGLLWASEGMAHRAALTQAGTAAVLSVERIRGGATAQTAVLNPADRLALAKALLSDTEYEVTEKTDD